ncbi:hypothetical protein [Streptomyces sp. NPDC005732]|uniref:hypothetical protein n=1 Tax=Streptomyces sp. NPDC005732 TaxID=3157057 RepID=UPI00340FD23C
MSDTKAGAPGADEQRIRRILQRRGVGPDAEIPTAAAVPDAVADAAAAAIAQTTAQPQPTAREDWWDRLYEEADAQPSGRSPAADRPAVAQPGARRWRQRIPDWRSGRHADLSRAGEDDDRQEQEETAEPDEDLADDDTAPAEDDDAPASETDARPARGRRAAQPKAKPRSRRAPRSRSRGARGGAAAPRALTEPLPRSSLLDAYDLIPGRIRWLIFHGSAAAAGYRIGWVDYCTRTTAWIADGHRLHLSSLVLYGCAFGCALLHRRARGCILLVRWLAAVPIASVVTGVALYGTDWTAFHLELPL